MTLHDAAARPPLPDRRPAWPALAPAALAAALLLAGCATTGGGTPGAPAAAGATAAPAATSAANGAAAAPRPGAASAPAGAAASPAGAAAAPAPGQPPPFAVVAKDARRIDGLFTAWQKDDKVWLELRPEDFEQPFFLSPKLRSGIGEAGLYGGLMLRSARIVQFRRVHNLVQLVAVNRQQVAAAGTPEARAVAVSQSPSLLGSSPVASQPHPERKTVLVDIGAVFLGDLMGLGAELQRTYRQGYALDPRNSAITAVRGAADLLVLETLNHYATAAIAVPQPNTPPGAPVPTVPGGLPDARSLFLGLHFSLARLPAQPMAARPADPRVGHFVSSADDFGNDLVRQPRQRWVNRWRLEKQDPAAALSEPVKPITYWLDRNVPVKYRAALTAGVLEWNKAFERIGFKNAIVVQQQPDDANWDTLDAGVASLRWMTNREPVFGAIGPSHVDPRSGEILDADIGFESLSSRSLRHLRAKVLGGSEAQRAADWAALLQVGRVDAAAGQDAAEAAACHHADGAAEQLAYALDLLAARGELDPDSPEAEAFVQAYMKDVAMHEVGHTLGLRHNFRASRVYSDAQVRDPGFGQRQALTGSVMEYAAINLPRPGEPAVAPFQTTLGPYDYWAIEYAYRPLPAGDETAELRRIAARSAEPELAFGTDEDNFLGIDPDTLHFDLGNDALAFASRRFDIAADLFRRQETRPLKPDEDYGSLRRALAYAVRDAGRAAGIVLRQVGGLRTLRDFPGSGRDPLQPVAAADQRAALKLLAERALAADAFRISPALARRLAPDFFERSEAPGAASTEYPLAQTVLDLQRALLNRLMGDTLAARLLDNATRVSPPEQPLRLAELHAQLEAAVWSELAGGQDIPGPRRELQREHINRLAALVLRPAALTRSDARALVRGQALALAARLEAAARRPGLGAEARLHLQDCAESLRSALAAPLQRAGA